MLIIFFLIQKSIASLQGMRGVWDCRLLQEWGQMTGTVCYHATPGATSAVNHITLATPVMLP